MKRLREIALTVLAIVAAFIAVAGLMGMLNEAVLSYISMNFATKGDMVRVEKKIDTIATQVDELTRRHK